MTREVWTIEAVEVCLRDLHPPLLLSDEDHSEASDNPMHAPRRTWGSAPSFLPRVDADWLLDGIEGGPTDQRESIELESQLYTSEVEFLSQIEAMLRAIDDTATRGEHSADFESVKDEARSPDDCEASDESDDDEFGEFQAAPSSYDKSEAMIDQQAGPLVPPPHQDAEEADHEESTRRINESPSEAVLTPVLLERVDAILDRWGADNRIATPNDSSGEATFDTGQLLQISSALLSVEEKKDEDAGIDVSQTQKSIPHCFSLASNQEESLTGVGRYPGSDDSDVDDDDLHSFPQVGRVTTTGADRSDEYSGKFAERKIPESIEAPCIHKQPSASATSGYDDGLSCERRISLRLPVEDLTTLEGRFTRRRQTTAVTDAPATAGDTGPDLPPFYYSPDVDDTVHILRALPWSYLEREDDRVLWDETIESRLRHLDTALSDVRARIGSSLPIQDLGAANSLVHECQLHLDLALMYHERANDALEEILEHPDDSVELWQQRDTFRELQAVLKRVGHLCRERDELHSRIDGFDVLTVGCLDTYATLAAEAELLLSGAKVSPLYDLRCLDGLRIDLEAFPRRFWGRLLSLNQAMVIQACHDGALDEERYLQLLHRGQDLQLARVAGVLIDFRQEWSRNLRDTLFVAAEQALVSVLLDCDGDCDEPSVDLCVQDLRLEFSRAPENPTTLRAIAHNLVILRFQMSKANLASICHSLLRRLWNVLRTHEHLTACLSHNDGDAVSNGIGSTSSLSGDLVQGIHSDLEQLRPLIWNHCEGTLLRLLREYLSFSAACNLFNGGDDMLWSQDLHRLSQVLALADHFLSLRPFVSKNQEVARDESSDKPASDLLEGLKDVFLRHLRNVHVEAMNSTGRMLCNETWILDSTELPFVEETDNVKIILESLMRLLYKLAPPPPHRLPATPSKTVSPPENNPFGSTLDVFLERTIASATPSTTSVVDFTTANELVDLLPSALVSSCLEVHDGTLHLMAPRCITDGLLRWTARLLSIMRNLPLIVEEVSTVLADLIDLHLTTTFRLCCGSARAEKILLGSVKPSPHINVSSDLKSPQHRANTSGSPLFSSLRKGSMPAPTRSASRSSRLVLPTALDTEICAPVLRDLPQVLRLRMFLLRAQDSLQDVVNLDKVESWLTEPRRETDGSFEEHCCGIATLLEKRTCALWSCNVVALVAAASLHHSYLAVQMPLFCRDLRFGKNLSLLRSFVQSLLDITPVLTTVACRFVCTRAVGASDIVKNILVLDSKWNERELHEHANDFVYDLSERMSLVWGYLCLSRKLPLAARSAVWENMVHGAYLSLLEGFARVPCSSTEGRSLMMLDLVSLSSELSASAVEERLERRSITASSPPTISPDGRLRPYNYVETYIKMVYFPKEDAATWIDQNYSSYQLNHMLSLAKEISGVNEEEKLTDHVKDLFTKAEFEIVQMSMT